MWSKTVFLINYDENDGLFDHIVPPMPPLTQQQNAQGLVSPDLVEALQDEFMDMDQYPHELRPLVPGTDPGGLQPIGLGPRVPMLIVSPWTTGGWVCSQTFDHTSVLQFLETRFGIREPNINRWRRAICGDLTSAFDFAGMSNPAVQRFPVPAISDSLKQPYSVPAEQSMPQQEPGTRPARALPYAVTTQSRIPYFDGGEGDSAWEPGNPCLTGAAPGTTQTFADGTVDTAPLPIGRFGNAQVGSIVGPGMVNLSSGLSKYIVITARVKLRVEGTFTNVLNHTNLSDPNLDISNANFGSITTARGSDFGGSRTGQVSMRLEF